MSFVRLCEESPSRARHLFSQGVTLRKLAVLVALAVLTSVAPAAAVDQPREAGPVSYDDYLRSHLTTPAVERAERFVAKQERLGSRLAPEGGYGRAGCTLDQTYEVGDTREFWVSPSVANVPQPNKQIEATLATKSEHSYVWVETQYYAGDGPGLPEGGFVTQDETDAAAEDWEKIYGINRSYFGSEPRPDVVPKNLPPGLPSDWRDADCDYRIHILNFPIDTPGSSGSFIAGYYSSEHEYPNGNGEHESPFSNEAEMFFMNSVGLDVGSDTYAGVLAHEFFHMIQFGNDYNEATWVNEGMADIAARVNGFNDVVDGHITSYEDDPDQHLFDWKSEVSDYGQAFLFFDYLFNHYGRKEVKSTDVLEAYKSMAGLLTRTSADGAKGISRVLRTRSKKVLRKLDDYYRSGNFKKVFKDNIVANLVDDPGLAQGQFGYANRDVQVATTGSGDASPDGSTVHPYGADYYDVSGKGQLDATVEDPVAVIPAREGQPAPEGGFFSWSNRSDEMITWLQRSADLSGTTAPQLVFDHWYQIEEDWDYGYVRVSRDEGNTWDYLTTTDCGGKATDPNGNNRAAAESGGITGDSGGWVECTLDLAAYAGGPVLIRWEYDTDQAVTEPGWAVDNVKLVDGENEIWASTDFETKTASRRFTFGGDGILKWLRLKPLAKNQPLLEVIRITGDRVARSVLTRRKFNKGDGGLVLDDPAKIAGDRSIVIFSGLTPIATDPYSYSYSIER